MATGIVSIDLSQHGMSWLARALLALNCVVYIWLLILSAWRVLAWPDAVQQDFVNPARGAAFLTLAVGTLVLSSQFLVVVYWPLAATLLAALGAVFWLVLTYLFLACTITARHKPGFVHSINGGWLVMVVATQALSIAASQLGATSPVMMFASICLYMLGAALYLMLITLVIYRLLFLRLRTRELTPPYWINMGALAITTLAGSTLVLHASTAGPLTDLLPFIKGFTVFFWATASWWIPLLLILGVWRHFIRGVRLRYGTDYWNIVFPVGMYSVSTYALAEAIGATFLLPIAAAGVYFSIVVWLTVAIAGLFHGVSSMNRLRQS